MVVVTVVTMIFVVVVTVSVVVIVVVVVVGQMYSTHVIGHFSWSIAISPLMFQMIGKRFFSIEGILYFVSFNDILNLNVSISE